MRTLVDLLNDESGYVRIFCEQEGFGYEQSAYEPHITHDLFDRMGGYPSITTALEAAQLQLHSLRSTRRRGRKVR
jgi:hypothetical protein